MKLLLTTALIAFASQASADGVRTKIEDHYTNETVSTPVYTNECYNVDVPVYGERRGGSNGDVLTGAVVGGVIGNQFGNGNGKDVMTILGAIVGANTGANRTTTEIVGYRTEKKCSEVVSYKDKKVRSYSYSTATFTVDGKTYTLEFIK